MTFATDHEKREPLEKILFAKECFSIQGAVFEVYREMGSGFLEAVYQECLRKEFLSRRIPFIAQEELRLYYKGEPLEQVYKPDFICFGKIIVELKAIKKITPEHKAQVFNYLKATSLKLGLIVNFGHFPKAEIARIIM